MTQVSDLYRSGTYEDHNPTYHVEDSTWKAGLVVDLLAEQRLAPRSICEIGCGAGEILKQLEARTSAECQLSGFDINPAAERLWAVRASARLRFSCADLPPAGQHFDLAVCMDVVEHVPDCFEFLRQLRPKADWHIFHIPLDMNVQMVLRGAPMRARRAAGHVHYFDKETALATLRETGYEVVRSGYTHHPPLRWRSKILWLPRTLLGFIHEDFAQQTLGGHSLLVLAR